LAGELGHQQVDPHGELLCGCGQRGCLEAHCGGMSIFNRFGKTAKDLSPLEWTDVVEWMTIGVHNAVTIQPVSRVIFGGGVAIKQPDHIEEIHRMLGGKLRIVDAPRVQLSYFGEGAGTVGALALIPLG
jgi:glucokinase